MEERPYGERVGEAGARAKATRSSMLPASAARSASM